MNFFVARDNNGFHYFLDYPDLVKFNPYSEEIEWTGYPVDFGKFEKEIKKIVENDPRVQDLDEFDDPLHINICDIKIEIL